MRLLLNQAPADGGGVAQVQASPNPPVQQAANPEPVAQPQAQPNGFVQIPATQLQQFIEAQAKANQLQSERAEQERLAQEKLTQAHIAKGEAEAAVKAVRGQLETDLNAARTATAEVEKRAKGYALRSELATILAGYSLNDGASTQLMTLLTPSLEVHPEGDGYVVRTGTYQSAADFVKATLARPDYAHFLRPSTQGGSGAGNSHIAPPPQEAGVQQPLDFQTAIIARFNQDQANRKQSIYEGFGLGRRPLNPIVQQKNN
ncbi:hypothetical protein [Singulisphaera sp. PoT]|uniref:hypothetical protein n=1 Tax=Singulisphaera sp. PoT TaxID=3411797 RepID=UPI003BF4AE4E